MDRHRYAVNLVDEIEELNTDQNVFNALDFPDIELNIDDLVYDIESDNYNIPFKLTAKL